MTIWFNRRSKWRIDGSRSIGVSAGPASGGWGSISFLDPSGESASLSYGFAGAGKNWGLTLPAALNVSGEATFTYGRMYMSTDYAGAELTRSDLTGPCYAADAAAVLGGMGVSTTVLFLGLSFTTFVIDRAFHISYPWLGVMKDEFDLLFGDEDPVAMDAKALVVIAGSNIAAGAMASAGGDGYLGWTWF